MQENPLGYLFPVLTLRAHPELTEPEVCGGEAKFCILIKLVDNEVPRESKTQADTPGPCASRHLFIGDMTLQQG